MTSGTLDKLEAAYQAHRDYVLGVLARRSPFIRPPDRQALYHDAFALVLEKARDRRLDVAAMNGRQLRAYLAKTAVLMALDQVRWGEGAHTRPLTDYDLERTDGAEPAEERVAQDSELAVLREIVAELPERRQAIVVLRMRTRRADLRPRVRARGRTPRARPARRGVPASTGRPHGGAVVVPGPFCLTRRAARLRAAQ